MGKCIKKIGNKKYFYTLKPCRTGDYACWIKRFYKSKNKWEILKFSVHLYSTRKQAYERIKLLAARDKRLNKNREENKNLLKTLNNIARHFVPNAKVVLKDYKRNQVGWSASKSIKGKKTYEIRISIYWSEEAKKKLRKQLPATKGWETTFLMLHTLFHELAHIVLGHTDKKDALMEKLKKDFDKEIKNKKGGSLSVAFTQHLEKLKLLHPSIMWHKDNPFYQDEIKAEKWATKKLSYFLNHPKEFKKLF